MLLYAAVVILVAILACYLNMEVISEQSFTVYCSPSKSKIFEFLKTPSNLERIHPRIQEVFDIHKHNRTTSFLILEDFGALLGRKTIPTNLTTSCLSQLTSCINLDFSSSMADVTVSLAISDYDTLRPTSATNALLPHDVPSATIHTRIQVKSMRIINYLISKVVLSLWEKTISSAIDVLEESTNLNHQESTNLH
ncbi:unnamed protein product [Candidula unifasciata]|uniref:Uncharacterized protein n=1 Tax=Candidula unifasciata TaxID=100452 RepID=A0A8S3YTT9_9EUPU|nr:unnamed protein product [Candidula unifasciata]